MKPTDVLFRPGLHCFSNSSSNKFIGLSDRIIREMGITFRGRVTKVAKNFPRQIQTHAGTNSDRSVRMPEIVNPNVSQTRALANATPGFLNEQREGRAAACSVRAPVLGSYRHHLARARA